MSDTETIAEMREQFGDEKTDQYLRMIKATAALVHVTTCYMIAEDGSPEEDRARKMWEEMGADIERSPEKARHIVESLATLVVHCRLGGSVPQWFKGVGVHIEPLEGEATE